MKHIGITISALIITTFLGVASTRAAMESSSYVIYENIHHSFDGPVITNVSHTVDENTVTVIWDTAVESDSFVIYDTDSGFIDSHEQGQGQKTLISHSVEVTGLEEETTYYYKVKSTRINGGTTIDNTVRSFTTGTIDTGEEGEEESSSSGGGILIIDKTDKIAPEITNIEISDITNDSATITWETDEVATEFVEYGRSAEYDYTYGNWATTTVHSITLDKLSGSRRYFFRALSSDDWGNVAYSEPLEFITLNEDGEEVEEPIDEPDVPGGEETDPFDRVREFLGRLFPQVALNNLGDDFLSDVGTLDDLANFIPAPILSGEPRVDIGATEVTVSWVTDVDSNSLVALAPDSAYSAEAAEPYQQIVGNSEEYVQGHEVTLYNLEPNTLYHYQLRSKASFGPMATSRDFTFTTSIEELSITSFLSQIIDTETAIFKWVTNKPSDSAVSFSPYQNNTIAVDQQKIVKDNTNTTIHEIEIKDFQAGVIYFVELISADEAGNTATENLEKFSTSEDDLPPEISHIKADSTIFIDRNNKIQTVISWMTNEPSTSRIHFQEGVHGGNAEMSEETELNTNYTKEHVMVINKFKPGIVYSFRAESIDSGGNVTMSKLHTFMTAKKKDSIIQIIMKILEDTFGWVKKLM
jgi:hypothetical protein